MVSDDTGSPSVADAAQERARRHLQFEHAMSALDWLFEHDFFGAHAIAAMIGLVTDGHSLTLLGAVGDLPVIERHDPIVIPLAGETPLCRAARLGEPTCLATADEVRRGSPWLATVAPAARSAITFPIRAGDRPVGAIGVTYSEPITDVEQLLERASLIGESLGASLRDVSTRPPRGRRSRY